MNAWILLLMNIAIGSIIGGVTNELAIRMLFRPYKPWRIAGIRVPFTPGLIPRRRDEIAVQMGRLVEEHLLTTEGVKRALAHGEMEQLLRKWMNEVLTKWLSDERTLRSLVDQIAPQLLAEEGTWSDTVRDPLKLRWRSFVARFVSRHEDKLLREVIPASSLEKLEPVLESFSRLLVERFRQYLLSREGEQTVQNMLRGLFSGGGGMFGGLVGMFLGDEKIISKLLPYLDELLQNPELAHRLKQFLRQESDRMLDKPVKEVLALLGDDQLDAWSLSLFRKLEEQTLLMLDKPIASLLGGYRRTIEDELIPRLAAWIVQTLQKNVERIFRNLAIRDIVSRQVEGFPIERIEEMIVGISGREFRMITILGFLLGGIIGVVQGLLGIWLG